MTTEELDARLDRISAMIEVDQAVNRESIEANRIASNRKAISELRASIEDMKIESKRWDERFFQLSRANLNIPRTIIVTAGAVVIFAPFLQAVAPAVLILIRQSN